MANFCRCLKYCWKVKRTLIFILTPVCLLPLVILYESKEARCAYGLALMATYWVTEVLPLAATALLPVILFPFLGILPVAEVCSSYIKDTSMFGIGCLTFAIAVETSNLHKRLAFLTLLRMGSNPVWLMLGFMLPTWFVSLWVNNTSATAMMIPIVTAVLSQLHDTQPSSPLLAGDDAESALQDRGLKTKKMSAANSAAYRRICKGMSLCVAYAANIGGTGSISGTSTNLIMLGQTQRLYQEYGLESGVTFTSWMVFALPGAFLSLLLAWIWLALLYCGPRSLFPWQARRDKVNDVLMRETLLRHHKTLGPVSFEEKAVIGHFLALVCLWLSRNPPLVSGWGSLFPPKYVGDSAAAILVALSLFVFPAQPPSFFCRSSSSDDEVQPRAGRTLLDWKTVQAKYPWGILLLLGGGFALADACEASGLSRLIGQELVVFARLSPWQLLLVLTAIIALATEVTSNSATASFLLPILGQLAINLGINPLYFLFPCAIATSFAFMLPVATPPNAIVFATGHLEVKDMVIAGSMLNVICILVVNLAANTWGMAYFKLDTLSPEFRAIGLNQTLLGSTLYDNENNAHWSNISTLSLISAEP